MNEYYTIPENIRTYEKETIFKNTTNLELSELYKTRLDVYNYVREICGGKVNKKLLKEIDAYVFTGVIEDK